MIPFYFRDCQFWNYIVTLGVLIFTVYVGVCNDICLYNKVPFFNPSFYFLFTQQAQECTAHQSGSSTTATTGVRPRCGRWACCCTTWCVGTSPLNRTRRSPGDRSSSGGESPQVRVRGPALWLKMNWNGLKNVFDKWIQSWMLDCILWM